MAAALVCAVLSTRISGATVELVADAHSGIKPLSARSHTFAGDWDGWLRKVTLQVKAAVDLAKGLPAAKKERLDGILAHDVAKDFKSGETVAADLKERYGGKSGASAAARRKAAVQAAAHSIAKARSADEDVESAAPRVSAAQIKKTVTVEGKSGIDPYGKRLGNKVAKDDSLVTADEKRVQAAENKLLAMEGQKAVAPRAAAAHHPARVRQARRKEPAAHAGSTGPAHAAVKGGRSDFDKGKALLAAIDAKKASSKLHKMQGDISMVLESTPGDKAKARVEEKQEESEFAQELAKLGLAPSPEPKKSKEHWPSQLELPGEGQAKAMSRRD